MPEALFDPIFVDEMIGNNYGSLQSQTDLITLFSIVAIVIACIGLMGMSAFIALNKWLMSFWLVFHEFWY